MTVRLRSYPLSDRPLQREHNLLIKPHIPAIVGKQGYVTM